MFSFHNNRLNLGRESIYAYNWQAYQTDDGDLIGSRLTKYAHSPITWVDGRRRKNEFAGANWIALDFDDGRMSLDQGVEKFAPYTAILATSRSHQKPKKDLPACDRFHVYLRLSEAIYDAVAYEAVVRYYATLWGADLSACDAARKFWPCREIILPARENLLLPLQYLALAPYSASGAAPSGDVCTLPRWVEAVLKDGPEPGHHSRNLLVYRVARRMKAAGYNREDAVERIMSSALPLKSDHVRREVEDAVRNAYRIAT